MIQSSEQVNNFLQSPYWAEFQRFLGRDVWHLDSDCIASYAYESSVRFGFKQLYIPRGPEIDFSGFSKCARDPLKIFVEWLERTADDSGSFAVIVEPRTDWLAQMLIGHGFEFREKSIQPHKTIIINLDVSVGDILSNFHHKLRYNINIAKKNDIKIVESDDVAPFLELLKKTTTRDGFSGHLPDYYRKMVQYFSGHKIMPVKIMYAMKDNNFCASALILEYGGTGYYLHGASDYEFRNLMAPHLMHWEIIQDLKGRGLSLYDMWGIDDKKYPGVTRFKMQFAGQIVEYPGAFVLPVKQLVYWIYKNLS